MPAFIYQAPHPKDKQHFLKILDSAGPTSLLRKHHHLRRSRGDCCQTVVAALGITGKATIVVKPQFALGAGNKIDPSVGRVIGKVEGSSSNFPSNPREVLGVLDDYRGSRRPRLPPGDFRLRSFQDLTLRDAVDRSATTARNNEREEK